MVYSFGSKRCAAWEHLKEYKMEPLKLSNLSELQLRWKSEAGEKVLRQFLQRRTKKSILSERKSAIDEASQSPTDLRAADLSSVSLHDSVLSHMDARSARFASTSLSGVSHESDFTDASFEKSDIFDMMFWKVKLVRINCEKSKLVDVFFEEVDLNGAKFNEASLEKVRFSHVDLTTAMFEGAKFKKCKFYAVKISRENKAFWDGLTEEECSLQKIEWV